MAHAWPETLSVGLKAGAAIEMTWAERKHPGRKAPHAFSYKTLKH